MHSNSHLGISLAAMVHLAAAVPNLTYACDTHWPWKTEDVLAGSPFTFSGGALAVPAGPGLGIELDRDALARLHEQYLTCGLRNRDDTGYMRRVDPGYERLQPRWETARWSFTAQPSVLSHLASRVTEAAARTRQTPWRYHTTRAIGGHRT
jgi:Enolase C-terminal domain-like